MICKHKSKLNCSKYDYVSLTIQLSSHLLNDQTVLFQIIQFSISHLFALSFAIKQMYQTNR